MNNATHTPGPWVVEGSDITNDYPDQGSRILIAEKGAIESDAHLIAAAPAMYEALKAMLGHEGERVYSGIGTEHDSEALEAAKQAARAALAQADGE